MTDRSIDAFDAIDPFERGLFRRTQAWTAQAVVPIDARAVVEAAVVAGRRGLRDRLTGLDGKLRAPARIGIVVAAGLLIAGAGTMFTISIGPRPVTVDPSPSPTPSPRLVFGRDPSICRPDEVDAVITAWDAAADHRTATVELHHTGTRTCDVPTMPMPWLADRDGDSIMAGHADDNAPRLAFSPGEVLHTLVQVGNYCGPEPAPPVTLVFQHNEGIYVATALSPTDLSGVPPCWDEDGPRDDIQMQPWRRSPG
jgi:hypothetical protein